MTASPRRRASIQAAQMTGRLRTDDNLVESLQSVSGSGAGVEDEGVVYPLFGGACRGAEGTGQFGFGVLAGAGHPARQPGHRHTPALKIQAQKPATTPASGSHQPHERSGLGALHVPVMLGITPGPPALQQVRLGPKSGAAAPGNLFRQATSSHGTAEALSLILALRRVSTPYRSWATG